MAGGLDDLLRDLGDDLSLATLRVYHGTRTDDAGVFFREGLKVRDRAAIVARLAVLTGSVPDEAPSSALGGAVADVGNEHDVGRLYVVVDERPLLERAAQYLTCGSEWMLAVSDAEGRRRLRAHGAPTLLEIDLPLAMTNAMYGQAFARVMSREWARLICDRPDWAAPLDFTFCLYVDIPPACVVGHRHPTDLRDPTRHGELYRSKAAWCRHCGAAGR